MGKHAFQRTIALLPALVMMLSCMAYATEGAGAAEHIVDSVVAATIESVESVEVAGPAQTQEPVEVEEPEQTQEAVGAEKSEAGDEPADETADEPDSEQPSEEPVQPELVPELDAVNIDCKHENMNWRWELMKGGYTDIDEYGHTFIGELAKKYYCYDCSTEWFDVSTAKPYTMRTRMKWKCFPKVVWTADMYSNVPTKKPICMVLNTMTR